MFEYDKMHTTFTLLANMKALEDLSTRWSVRRTTYQNVDSSEEYLLQKADREQESDFEIHIAASVAPYRRFIGILSGALLLLPFGVSDWRDTAMLTTLHSACERSN